MTFVTPSRKVSLTQCKEHEYKEIKIKNKGIEAIPYIYIYTWDTSLKDTSQVWLLLVQASSID